jgi:RNA polymerase sigma-70 factor (ECF subfamily)
VGVLDASVDSLPMSGATAQDPSLLERAQRGDVAAVAEIYDRHHGPLCAFARRLLGSDAAAEDLVHDVFLVLPEVLRRADPGGSLRRFLMAVAANRAKHHFRARSRFEKMADRLAHERVPDVENPEQQTSRRALAARLSRALDVLSFEQRVAFVLCEIEGRGSPEAAAILGIPESTVRTRLFGARRALRKHLTSEELR